MPPKGKSKASALKHSYLGQFTKNARSLEEMKALISTQEQTLSELESQNQRLGKVIVERQSEINSKQNNVKKVRRKLAHKTDTLLKLTQKVKNVDLQLTKAKTDSK